MTEPYFDNVQAAEASAIDSSIRLGLLTPDAQLLYVKLKHTMIGPLIIALSVAHRQLQPQLPERERDMRRVMNGVAASADLMEDGSVSLSFELENGVEVPFVLKGDALYGLASELFALAAPEGSKN